MLLTTKLENSFELEKMYENTRQSWLIEPGKGTEVPDRIALDVIAGDNTKKRFVEFKKGQNIEPVDNAKVTGIEDQTNPPTREELEDEEVYPVNRLKLIANDLAQGEDKPHPNLGRAKLIDFILSKIED